MNTILFCRISLFILYFWFGILKVFNMSPASPLVQALAEKTLPDFVSFPTFLIVFGLFEMLIGVLFLIRRAERVAIGLFVFHMVATFMPLFLVPAVTWQAWFVPTLEGQYIVKNLVLIAVVLVIARELKTCKSS